MSKYGDWTRGEDEALLNILGGVDVARRVLRGEAKVKVEEPDLLKRVATVSVSGAKRFVVKDKLKPANVGWTGDDLKEYFLDKVEENIGKANLAVHRLEKASLDAPILAELGDRAETSLAYLFELLRKQSRGEQGVLLTNGCANIVYVRDAKGTFWAVAARWYFDFCYWSLHADSVEDPRRWGDDSQVLSRDPGF